MLLGACFVLIFLLRSRLLTYKLLLKLFSASLNICLIRFFLKSCLSIIRLLIVLSRVVSNFLLSSVSSRLAVAVRLMGELRFKMLVLRLILKYFFLMLEYGVLIPQSLLDKIALPDVCFYY